jgi:hypothetical protein
LYSNVITWRLAPGEDLHQFVRDITAQVGDWPPPGMIDGYVVQAGPDRVITIGIYENPESADAVAAKLRLGTLGERARFVDRQAGETHDIWGPDPMWDS